MRTKLIIAILPFIIGCHSLLSSLPRWIQEPHQEYPPELYIVSVGSGDSRASAEEQARVNIAKVFETEIKAREELVEKYTEVGTERKTCFSQSIELLRKTSLQTHRVLKNIVIDKVYFERSGKKYYALAYLDRQKTTRVLLQEIQENALFIERYYQKFKEELSPIKKYVYLSQAISYAFLNQKLRGDLRILQPQRTFRNTSLISLPKMLEEYTTLAASIRVRIELEEDSEPVLRDFIKEMVAKLGFGVSEEEARFKIMGKLLIKEIDLGKAERRKFVRWEITVNLCDILEQVCLTTFTAQGREGHLSYAQARARAKRVVREKINSEFYLKIKNYLKNITEE
jgi:hypothetical protein